MTFVQIVVALIAMKQTVEGMVLWNMVLKITTELCQKEAYHAGNMVLFLLLLSRKLLKELIYFIIHEKRVTLCFALVCFREMNSPPRQQRPQKPREWGEYPEPRPGPGVREWDRR